MQFNFAEMWQHMGLPAIVVALVLHTAAAGLGGGVAALS